MMHRCDTKVRSRSAQQRVGADGAHDRERRHRVGRRDEATEEEGVERRAEVERVAPVAVAEGAGGAHAVEHEADEQRGEQRAADGEDEDGAQVGEERALREREARLEDDGRQQQVQE